MSDNNDKIIHIFNALAMFKTLEGDTWRAKTYSRVAETVQGLNVDISEVPDIYELPGIGKSSGGKIEEILETGESTRYTEYMEKYPGLLELTRVDGIGPKKAYKFWSELNVRSIADLKARLVSGDIKSPKMLESVEHLLNQKVERLNREDVLPFVDTLLQEIRSWKGVIQAEFAGSIRRKSATVRDVDILIAADAADADEIRSAFIDLAKKNGHDVLAEGGAKSRIRLPIRDGQKIQVDLLTTLPKHFGAALNYFTGSRDHNIKMRVWAKMRNWLINEYGLWTSEGKRLDKPGLDERNLFDALGLVFVEPEVRDGTPLVLKDQG